MCLKKLKKYSYKEMRSAVRFAERSTAKLILSNINDVIPSAPPRMLGNYVVKAYAYDAQENKYNFDKPHVFELVAASTAA